MGRTCRWVPKDNAEQLDRGVKNTVLVGKESSLVYKSSGNEMNLWGTFAGRSCHYVNAKFSLRSLDDVMCEFRAYLRPDRERKLDRQIAR